jgi:hypothetical protein
MMTAFHPNDHMPAQSTDDTFGGVESLKNEEI